MRETYNVIETRRRKRVSRQLDALRSRLSMGELFPFAGINEINAINSKALADSKFCFLFTEFYLEVNGDVVRVFKVGTRKPGRGHASRPVLAVLYIYIYIYGWVEKWPPKKRVEWMRWIEGGAHLHICMWRLPSFLVPSTSSSPPSSPASRTLSCLWSRGRRWWSRGQGRVGSSVPVAVAVVVPATS